MLLNRFFHKSYPFLDWIQIEISSYCNAQCIYCPHTIYAKNWQNRFMPVDVFETLLPAFKRTKLVHLQGWGEPFTHPHFVDMLRSVKKVGCQVGTTTNGMLLDGEMIETLVKEGLDLIGFSLAGVDEKNDFIRKGTRINHVIDCIEKINNAKIKYGTDTPKMHIAYMLMRSGISDLEKLPAFLANIGAAQTVVSSLSLVAKRELESESILASGEKEYLEFKKRLSDIRNSASDLGANIHFHIVSSLFRESHCSENIHRALVIGSDGSVSPCVMTQIPFADKNCYYFKGQKEILQKLSFGNTADDSLNNIWHRQEYTQFIKTLLCGQTPNLCQNCYKRFIERYV
ncbi:MAG: radical SAM protein [Deltaproteobacteria bacterium]|nr:radical SAM protein [Deltaproteobacteria bacterium]